MSHSREQCIQHSKNHHENKDNYNKFLGEVSMVLFEGLLPDNDNTGFLTCGGSGGWKIQFDHRIRGYKVVYSGPICRSCRGYLKMAVSFTNVDEDKLPDLSASLTTTENK